jgi:pilus assembly protein CpaE
MPLKFSILCQDEGERLQLEALVQASSRAALADRGLGLPQSLAPNDPALRQLQAQSPEVVLLALPQEAPESAFALLIWLKAQMPLVPVMVVGPMEPPQLIVATMRAGAAEYLERPLRPATLDEALTRCAVARGTVSGGPARGKLVVVLGARGGCGATTVAVNLALALNAQRRESDGAVALVDAAPLGHTALHLNLKSQYTLADLFTNLERLDSAMLSSLLVKHSTGLQVLAGPHQPLPHVAEDRHAQWLETLLQNYSTVIMDLSARHDGLTKAVLEVAERVLFVTQTDMVSLWSAAKVRQYLDSAARLRFELVLNRFTATPDVDLDGLQALTKAPLLWKLPNAHALVTEAIESGKPPSLRTDSDLAKSYRDMALLILGRPAKKKRHGFFPFLRTREVEI